MATRRGWTASDASARKRPSSQSTKLKNEWLGLPDEAILEEAAAPKLTLVTYDLKTIPPLLKTWLEAGRDHGGVIFVDQETIRSSDRGGLIRTLRKLVAEAGQFDWPNQVVFLRR